MKTYNYIHISVPLQYWDNVDIWNISPESKVHGTNMGPIWVLSAPDGPHVGPMDLAIWVFIGPIYPAY